MKIRLANVVKTSRSVDSKPALPGGDSGGASAAVITEATGKARHAAGRWRSAWLAVALVAGVGGLSACGQSGALYLPPAEASLRATD